MRERSKRIATPLALAISIIGLEAPFVQSIFGEERAAVDGSVTAAASGVATPSPPRIKSSPGYSSFGKPVAPIAIGYDLSAQPQLGVPFDVRISADGRDRITDLTLTVFAQGGVEVGTPQLTTSSADGALRVWTVAATAFGGGTAYLSVLAQGTADDQHPARNLVISIRIVAASATAPAAVGQSTTDSLGQHVVVLPAERDR